MSKKFITVSCLFGILMNAALAGAVCIPPAGTSTETRKALQAVLNQGNDCVLCQKGLYEIDSILVYKAPNQKIYTENAEYLSQYATIRTTNRNVLPAINGQTQDSVVLEKVIVDGNRYRIGANDKVDGEPPLLMFGVKSGHKIRNNIFMSTRCWSTLQAHEGGGTSENNIIENNLFLGAGPDGRGNGLCSKENQTKKGHWGDCISLAANRTMVRNNFLMEPTDLGVAIFSAPGSIIENNVQTSWSREALSSFDMVDGITVYADGSYAGLPAYHYTGTIIRNNYSDAYGSRIHIGFALGQPIWQGNYVKVMKKGTVTGNTMSGDAYGYGIAVNGVVDFTVTGNVSNATHSGKGNGVSGKADEPSAFQYLAANVYTSTLQPEFKTGTNLMNLLRCNAPPYIDGGNFVATPYTNQEAAAIVKAAYVEMLHRLPTATELTERQTWLQTVTYDAQKRPRNLNTADKLRLSLVQTDEFKKNFGTIAATQDAMQLHRIDEWQKAFTERIDAYVAKNSAYPPIKSIYLNILGTWEGKIATGTIGNRVKAGVERFFTFSFPGMGTVYSCTGEEIQSVIIYSLAGGIIKEIPVDAASRNVMWDGKDDFGRKIANGVYPARIKGLTGNRYFTIAVSR